MAAIFVGVRKDEPKRLVRLQSATESWAGSKWAWSGLVGVAHLLGLTTSVVESHTPTCSEKGVKMEIFIENLSKVGHHNYLYVYTWRLHCPGSIPAVEWGMKEPSTRSSGANSSSTRCSSGSKVTVLE